MKAIEKNFHAIPLRLIDEKRKEAFLKNKTKASYCCSNSNYKVAQKELKILYNKKCAYCEKTLVDTDKHVEHYRPKSIYYWLAFSWDNLLLACAECNRKKTNIFAINGERAVYNSQSLEELQSSIQILDGQEKPRLINPEQVSQSFLNEHLKFHLFENPNGKEGELSSSEDRLIYTIEICDLNREELRERRLTLLQDLKNAILERKALYKEDKEMLANEVRNLLRDEMRKFADTKREFSAWRKAIITQFSDVYKNS